MATRKAKAETPRSLTLKDACSLIVAVCNATDKYGQAATMWQSIQEVYGKRKHKLDAAEVDMIKDQADKVLNERLTNKNSIKTIKSRVVKLTEYAPVILNQLTGEVREKALATWPDGAYFASCMRKADDDLKAAVAMFTAEKVPDYVASTVMKLNSMLAYPAGRRGVQSAQFKADVVALADKYNLKLKGADDYRSDK